MKKPVYIFLLSFVLFITHLSFVFAGFSSSIATKAEVQRKIALTRLENSLDDTGKELQTNMDLHVHNMDVECGIYDEVPMPELNAIILSRYISEKFS